MVNEFIEADKEGTQKLIKLMQNDSAEILSVFQTEAFESYIEAFRDSINKEGIDYYSCALDISKLCSAIAINPTNENISKLRELVPHSHKFTFWMTPMQEVIDAITKFNNSNLQLFYSFTIIMYYQFYLPEKFTKIAFEVFKMYKVYDNERKSIIEIEYFKAKQNMKKRENDVFHNEIEVLLHQQEILARSLPVRENSPFDMNKYFKKAYSFNAGDMLIADLYNSAFDKTGNGIKETDKLVLFFDLFRLLMKDKKWMSKDEFENNIDTDKNGNPVVKYRGRYRQYQINKMKKFLTKK